MIKESFTVDGRLLYQAFHQGKVDECQTTILAPKNIGGELLFYIPDVATPIIATDESSLMTVKLENA